MQAPLAALIRSSAVCGTRDNELRAWAAAASDRWTSGRHCEAKQKRGGIKSKTNLWKELGLNNERGVSGEVALAEHLEVAVGSDVDDGHLLLGEGLWREGREWAGREREEGCERDARGRVQAQSADGRAKQFAGEESAAKQRYRFRTKKRFQSQPNSTCGGTKRRGCEPGSSAQQAPSVSYVQLLEVKRELSAWSLWRQ